MSVDDDAQALQADIVAAFDEGGPLARADVRYRPRDAQLRLAAAVGQAITNRGTLVAEAGTGIGKTFAYLVPLLLSGARALVSTATKSLQDQLFLRDLPRLRDALGVPASIALLKGRGSYLCLHRLKLARQDEPLHDRWAVRTLARVEQWSVATRSGDLAEIDGLDERSMVIPMVTSTRDNCLGSECPDHRSCHVMKARRDAMAADLVVVNHHLFFADLALRDSGVSELLPTVDAAVFDEAHQLAEAGVQFLGRSLGSSQLLDFSRDLLAAGMQFARGVADWPGLSASVEQGARQLRLAVDEGSESPMGWGGASRGPHRLRWEPAGTSAPVRTVLGQLQEELSRLAAQLTALAPSSPDLGRMAERARQLQGAASGFSLEAAVGRVRWIDRSSQQVRLVESPLDIRDALSEQRASSTKAWIFTSATLGDDENLSWFCEPAGLDDATRLRVGSPFDYAAHARLFVPSRFPKPNEPGHPRAVGLLASRCALALGGRCFVLTTTLRAMETIATVLRETVEQAGGDIEVLVQGSAPKRQLMQRFVEGPAAVLVGSQSFWEGIDVPGDALQCVLIDKLPFPPPNDPLVEARVKRLEVQGRSPFQDYFVAEAAVSLKQGAGRLIRTESDRGLLVVCDPRMATMSYGRRLRQALPPMGAVANVDDALAWLGQLRQDAQPDD